MKVLVVGERRETRVLVRLLEAADRQTEYFADRSAALAVLAETDGNYDYVVLEGEEQAGGNPELLRSLRGRNDRVPVVFLRPAADPGELRLIGAFERSPRGLKPLNCVLTEVGPAATDGNCVLDIGRIVYEYQSTCRRRES